MTIADTLVIAHRGTSSEAPENTLAAFRLALAQGCDAIELDIHLSADGRVIVCHDATIDRTTNGSGAIAEMTAAQLQQYDAGSWFGESFASERLPLLDEVLDLVPASVGINIEIKSYKHPEAERTLVALLEARNRLDSVFFSSFGHECLLRLKRWSPASKIGLLYEKDEKDYPGYFKRNQTDGYSLHPSHEIVDASYVEAAKRQGLKVYPWTIDDPQRMRELIRAGVSGIITNRPKLLRELLKEQSAQH